jgi:mono/diheme cytochrome c family protein
MNNEKGSNVGGWFVIAAGLGLASLAGACGPGGGADAAVTPDAAPPADCSSGDVAMGRMASTMRGCAACHGADLGGAVSGTPGQNLTSSNLGDWTDAEMTRAILDGIDDEGATLCTSMPAFRTSRMTGEEVCNIVAYLRSLDPVTRDVVDTCM